MSRRILALCCAVLSLSIAPVRGADVSVEVDETAARATLAADGVGLELPVRNLSRESVTAPVVLELVAPDDSVVARTEGDGTIAPGASVLVRKILARVDDDDLRWLRLRYRIGESSGVVALSEISHGLFELFATAPEYYPSGERCRVHAFARHPFTSAPVPGVTIEATVENEDDSVVTLARRTTDDHGRASFEIEPGERTGEWQVEVSGRLGVATDTVALSIRDLAAFADLHVSTDKRLYQPGQTVRARLLAFDAERRAVASTAATLKLKDGDDDTLFETEVTTSRHGIAAAEWTLPEDAKLGRYYVEARLDDDRFELAEGYGAFSVSRYDLPNFTIAVEPDRSYYLPEQDAVITVRADYLFGKPVSRGTVRVLHERERAWNYREQKWEVKEGQTWTGELSPDGRFTVRVELDEEHERLKEDDWSRYDDLSFAAYVTDASTGRTEQRRFDLRLSREAIHVYVADTGFAAGVPALLYVVTSYPDGQPAECDVAISEPFSIYKIDTGRRHAAQVIRTNRHGVARVETAPLPQVDRYDNVEIAFTARDAGGNIGHHTESLYYGDSPLVRIDTAKTIFAPGEPIVARIEASRPRMDAVVVVRAGGRTVESRFVEIRDGRATVTIPWTRAFEGEVALQVAAVSTRSQHATSASRTVLFPHDDWLELDVERLQKTYVPGDLVETGLRMRRADGRPVDGVFGVVVVDKAVEERASANDEFGGGGGLLSYYEDFAGLGQRVGDVTRRDLDRIDPTRYVPKEVDLAAEILLNRGASYHDVSFEGLDRPRQSAADVFGQAVRHRTEAAAAALGSHYDRTKAYPEDERTLRTILEHYNIRLDHMRDPWDQPLTPVFSHERNEAILELESSGPDERIGTLDDLTVRRFAWPYFRPTGETLDAAVASFVERESRYVRGEATLTQALASAGIDQGSLRDRWGTPYRARFEISEEMFVIRFESAGPDGYFSTDEAYSRDDFVVWRTETDYFARERKAIDKILANHVVETGALPKTVGELEAALKGGGIDSALLVDPWGHRYVPVFRVESLYNNGAQVLSYAEHLAAKSSGKSPLTRDFDVVALMSAGADGKEGTIDDFPVATFSYLRTTQAANGEASRAVQTSVIAGGAGGVIRGVVTDPQGAIITGTKVTATNEASERAFEEVTDDDGRFSLRHLPAGRYSVQFYAAGFATKVVVQVPVRSSTVTQLDVELVPGLTGETVSVVASDEPLVDITSTKVAMDADRAPGKTALRVLSQIATPRLREYFPETLFWAPEVVADGDGRATISFPLADNITTWRMAVLASTVDGRIAAAEADLVAFQPFFVEHDPPKTLTEGDVIHLPVVLRNYLDARQTIDLDVKPAPWLELLGAPRQRVAVAAGDSARAIVPFRALAEIDKGPHRITAIGSRASDAIEKPVRVHPDGRETAATSSAIVRGEGALEVAIPADALGTPRVELRVYPNLLAHVGESVEAIMSRPYGCGEQTVSSTYPSVLLLAHATEIASETMVERARKYVRLGVERLGRYRTANGGYAYWEDGQADLALTAYALRFLLDASKVAEVDREAIDAAASMLLTRQLESGAWPSNRYGTIADPSILTTAYVARVLATLPADGAKGAARQAAVGHALEWLATKTSETDEPYGIAAYALAAFDSGKTAEALRAVERLKTLAREEGDGSYWSIETNTPFYGWGLAGRVETTALATLALSRVAPNDEEARRLADRGLVFLLRKKDRYGVWYSTQATINVLDAMLAMLSRSGGATGEVEILLNGSRVASVPARRSTAPERVDLTPHVARGANRIDVRGAGDDWMSAHAVATWYAPWEQPVERRGARAEGRRTGLRFAVGYDRTEATAGEAITCTVEAERIGSRGYGMMLGEIGIPPGAEVDRESLDRAVAESGWGLSRYEVLPDRVVVYLWPRAGGTKLQFSFKPRYGISALAAPSKLYDYYNPEAEVTLAPPRFDVR